MVSLGQKLKIPKTCEKPFYKNSRVILCKKRLEKTPNIREMRQFSVSAILQRLYSPCKVVSLGQKLKMPKTCEKPFNKNSRVVLCKKRLEKTPNIREIDSFENRPFCKGYSPCKMVSLGQKLKMPKTCEKPFYKNSRVLLCKKRLEKKT